MALGAESDTRTTRYNIRAYFNVNGHHRDQVHRQATMPIPEFLRERTQAAVGSINAHRILLYGAVSTIAVTAAIINALRNYSNFYSVAIYLSKSSRSVLVSAHSIHSRVVILKL